MLPTFFVSRFRRIKPGDLLLSRAGTDYSPVELRLNHLLPRPFPFGLYFNRNPLLCAGNTTVECNSRWNRGQPNAMWATLRLQRWIVITHLGLRFVSMYISLFSKVRWRRLSSCSLPKRRMQEGYEHNHKLANVFTVSVIAEMELLEFESCESFWESWPSGRSCLLLDGSN